MELDKTMEIGFSNLFLECSAKIVSKWETKLPIDHAHGWVDSEQPSILLFFLPILMTRKQEQVIKI